MSSYHERRTVSREREKLGSKERDMSKWENCIKVKNYRLECEEQSMLIKGQHVSSALPNVNTQFKIKTSHTTRAKNLHQRFPYSSNLVPRTAHKQNRDLPGPPKAGNLHNLIQKQRRDSQMWNMDDITPKGNASTTRDKDVGNMSPRSSYPEVIVNYKHLAPIQLEAIAGAVSSAPKPHEPGSDTNRNDKDGLLKPSI